MQMDELKLIELIKCNDSIYNTENKRYTDKDYKIQLWNMIARELGVSVHQCRARWFNLRDSFRRSCRNRKLKGTTASSKKWKYDDEMSFLVPFFHEKSNFDYSSAEDTTNCWDWGGVQEICNLNDTESNGMNTAENCGMTCVDIRGMNGPETLRMPENRGVPQGYLQDAEDEESNLHPTKRRCLPSQVPSPVSSYTDVDLAFASLAATVNSFPAYQRYLAKTNCFKIVFELEKELLLRGESQIKERQPDIAVKAELGSRQ